MSRLYHLHEFCRREHGWLIETIEALVRLESPTDDKAAVDRCGGELSSRLQAIGGRVTRLTRTQRGDHLLAEFGCGSHQLLILGHFDTVWPAGQLERMPLRKESGRLHGPGIFDMKAGIALAMLAVRAVLETEVSSAHRIITLWTSDEEVGSHTSRQAIEDEARRSEAVLVLEPSLPGGALKTARKACGQFELVANGVAAHAGVDPAKGASAIHELAHQIMQVQRLSELSPGITVNVGTVAGGSRANVVADQARAVVDVRASSSDEMRLVEERIRTLTLRDPRVRLEVSGGFERPPLERKGGVVRLYRQACDIARELGFELGEGSTGGGSDGNFTAALGVPTLDGLGAVGDGAHALHEHVDVESLPARAALIAGLLASL
jgi:glutamate carboxypeptidase